MRVLLISTYELGRQPFGLASPAAWLREAGFDVVMLDLSRQPLDREAVAGAGLVAFFLPMHTATRLAVAAIARVRELNASAHLCAYGLYAPLNADLLGELGIGTILGGEYEAGLVALATRISGQDPGGPGIERCGSRAWASAERHSPPMRGWSCSSVICAQGGSTR